MAKLQVNKNNFAPVKRRKKRPGVHAKTKYSKSHNSKFYTKLNKGQG